MNTTKQRISTRMIRTAASVLAVGVLTGVVGVANSSSAAAAVREPRIKMTTANDAGKPATTVKAKPATGAPRSTAHDDRGAGRQHEGGRFP